MSKLPPDHQIREQALNPEQSFIVQAPAGSGKTHLLIQRYLRLLAGVEQPEQIVAITFTVKAAAEMRARVLDALAKSRAGIKPEKEHEKSMAELADAAIARDEECGWDLEHFPARLRITTIDSLNRQLSGAAPLIAGGLSLNIVSDTPNALYSTTAKRMLTLMTDAGAEGEAVGRLLRHLDNNVDRFENLICAMLAQRDQWLPVIGTGAELAEQRHVLEETLRTIVEHDLTRLNELLSRDLRDTLLASLAEAAGYFNAENPAKQMFSNWLDREAFPDTTAGSLPVWRELACGLLTGKFDAFRKPRGVSKTIGFPTTSVQKPAFQECLESLQTDDDLLAALVDVAGLPAASFTDEQWEVLLDLLTVLPLCVAQLKLVFAESGETDFSEIAAEARAALGHPEAPSDLALAMDCSLMHILMDEFQDTSIAQVELLQRLIAGWQPGDGHSLFLVGDPMQSIYRFRQAEVGLFLNVAENGIGDLKPESVQLTANFRSTPTVVNWVNAVFAKALPEEDDLTIGAVKFSSGDAVEDDDPSSLVEWRVRQDKELEGEAVEVVELIKNELLPEYESNPSASDGKTPIGILVRGRRHAAAIASMLRQEGIPFAGADLEHMSDLPLVQDLVSLTRAMLHPADRLAWTALLRAPWCGLSLDDMATLLSGDRERRKSPVWALINDDALRSALSADGANRLGRFRDIIGEGYRRRGRLPLCDWIEGVWLSLAGPVAARQAHELDAAGLYFDFLEEQTVGDDIPDTATLLEQLAKQPVSFSTAGALVQIMTIHKSKGLEFDTVILPGLSRTTRGNDKRVLQWKEVVRPDGKQGLLLAPIDKPGNDTDPLYKLIGNIDKQQDEAERARLMYVATTRARRKLYLFAHLELTEEGEVKQAPSGSLASCLHSYIESSNEVAVLPPPENPGDVDDGIHWAQPHIHRLQDDWQLPAMPDAVATAERYSIPTPVEPITFDWAGTLARYTGTVVHHYLEQMSESGLRTEAEIQASETEFSTRLEAMGLPPEMLEEGVKRVRDALLTTVKDPDGRAIVSGDDYQSAASELAVTVWESGRPVQQVIDRYFVDAAGDRWVVDYKTSSHQGSGLEAFLDNEVVRYRGQLEAYRDAVKALEPDVQSNVRMGLYFPNLGIFREVTEGS